MRSIQAILVLGLAACGGGGGGASEPGPPVGAAAAFSATAEVLSATQSAGAITLSMAPTSSAPALIEVHVALPAELRVGQQGALTARAPVALEGDFDGNDFVVLCGDTSNAAAPPLPEGALFDLRVEPTEPRTPGTYEVVFRELRAATSAGQPAPLAATTFQVSVVIE
jgi:hypothetical protein